MVDPEDLEEPTEEYVVFTRQAYEDAVQEMADWHYHGGFMIRRALGDPIPLKHVGFFSKDYGFEAIKHGITGEGNNGDFAWVLGEPLSWKELNK